MTIETARDAAPSEMENKVPDVATNVLFQATVALKKLVRKQNDRSATD